MTGIDKSRTKIKEIEKLLAEIKDRLKTLSKESRSQQKRVITEADLFSKEELEKGHEEKISARLPSEEELQTEYEKLYEEFVVKNFKSIKEFINRRSKIYLKAFCQANRLPIDTAKVSKDRIVDEVMRWMAQRKAISKKVT
ncbi:MAG: hypothetical protein ACRENZ_11795 [Thermodesulfobacteriota bacterium]